MLETGCIADCLQDQVVLPIRKPNNRGWGPIGLAEELPKALDTAISRRALLILDQQDLKNGGLTLAQNEFRTGRSTSGPELRARLIHQAFCSGSEEERLRYHCPAGFAAMVRLDMLRMSDAYKNSAAAFQWLISRSMSVGKRWFEKRYDENGMVERLKKFLGGIGIHFS